MFVIGAVAHVFLFTVVHGGMTQVFQTKTLDRAIRVILTVNAKRDAARIAEIKLREVAVQMLIGAMQMGQKASRDCEANLSILVSNVSKVLINVCAMVRSVSL